MLHSLEIVKDSGAPKLKVQVQSLVFRDRIQPDLQSELYTTSPPDMQNRVDILIS